MTTASIDVGDILSTIAQSLAIPVLVGALLLLAMIALELGRFCGELWRRRRPQRGSLRALAEQARANPATANALAEQAPSALSEQAVAALSAAGADTTKVEHALADYELAAQRKLDRTRLLVRAGPALGLMGTLIPLAPGLEALSNGNVGSLASDLETAFGATVIGLLVGTVAFALTLYRTRMYTEDLVELERGSA